MNNDTQYLIGAYLISAILLWGYAAMVWLAARKLNQRERGDS